MGMNPETYVENAIITESRDFDAIKARLTDRNLRLLHSAMGVATEAGELLDAIKKALFYGKELDTVNFSEEMFDVMWYLAIGVHELRTSFEEGMDVNIAKLKARYGEKFDAARALKRDLKTERGILEGNPQLNIGTGVLGIAPAQQCPRCSSTDRNVRKEVYSDSSLYDSRECPHYWHEK
jgi:NTP pyrophosphatase (non-canonical NTP hydrolase)